MSLGAVGLAAFGLHWTSSRSDAVSVERQIRTTRVVIDNSIDDLAQQQEAVAIWDNSAAELARPALDHVWLRDNVSLWLYNMFGHNEVFILDGRDRPVHGLVLGKLVPADDFHRISRAVQPLVNGARGRSLGPNGRHDRNPGRELAPGTSVLTSSRTTHDSHILLVNGRPAAVSAMQMVESTPGYVKRSAPWPLLISVRYLDGDFLTALAERNLIDRPRFAREPKLAEGEQEALLRTEAGTPIGYIIWRPELPGTALVAVLGPVVALSALLLVAAMALLARWLRRATGELERSEAHAHRLAFHDPLTGLPNRAMFAVRLAEALDRASTGVPVALLALDLDRFKHVNDTYGHHAGDLLIQGFARRLSSLLAGEHLLVRLGGDEFAVLLVGRAPAEVEALCASIIDAVRAPFDVVDASAVVGVSIGLMYAPRGAALHVDLLRNADIALYQAKASGRNCWRAFSPDMDEAVQRRSQLEGELRAALASTDALRVHYQPLVDVDGRRVIGLEALVRWRHPVRGLIAPNQFIPVAEETGLISSIGEWVLREACLASRRFSGLRMAVNLSPVQFRDRDFAERVIAIVRDSGADPGDIELEVTESVLLDDDELVRGTLRRLRAAGLSIALDDFGTGYSSLSYLSRFQVDKIKIDQCFVRDLGRTSEAAAVITAVVTLGRAMRLAVVAEGVETREQLGYLSAAGCNAVQGHLFAAAMPEAEALAFVQAMSNLPAAA